MPSVYDNQRSVIVDHVSANGPVATHIRGTMLVGSLENLRQLGCYERYLELLAPEHRDGVKYCIAASWVPIEVALAHYQCCDALDLNDEQRRRLGEMMAERVAATFLGAVLRATRKAGIESFGAALNQNDRLYDRMYQGGGCRLLRTGPKDVVWETYGVPLAQSRHWRTAFAAYLQAIVRMFAKTAFVTQVHPERHEPHAIAFSVSYV